MIRELLTELARDGATGDPLNYMGDAAEALRELHTVYVALSRIAYNDDDESDCNTSLEYREIAAKALKELL